MPSIRFSLGWRFLTLPCLLTFFHSVAAAQSFDCAKAKTPTEKLICTHEPLGQLDEELMAAVRGAMPSDPDEKKEFLTEERAWLANRDKECTISERELSEKDRAGALRCLSKSYGDRIKQLRQRKSPVNAAERAAAIPEARSLSEPPPLPYSYGMFTVGDPAEKNTNLGLESAVTDGSDPESQPKTFSYTPSTPKPESLTLR